MGIQYREAHTTRVSDGASNIIREAHDFFQGERIQMTTKDGFNEILTSGNLFKNYVSRLAEGLNPDDVESFTQLLENTRVHILQEGVIAGIQQVSALSMPMIRKAWPRIGMRNAIPTEAVKTPQFAITYLTPYLVKQDGTKLELPKALRNPATSGQVLDRKWLLIDPAAVAPAPGAFPTVPVPNDETGVNLISDTPGAQLNADTVDTVLHLSAVTLQTTPGDALTDFKVTCELRLSPEGRLFGNVQGTAPVGHPAAGTLVKDTILGDVDLQTGVILLQSMKGNVASVEVTGFITDENNNHGDSVTFEIGKKDVKIGTGAHLNAPLPVEFLQDNMAIYNIDGALKVTDIISQVHAQKVDQELLQFLDKSMARTVAAGASYTGSFDVRPAQQYNGSPTEWRNELRIVIDWFATKMKQDSSMHTGRFALIGNPLDLMLIPNVDWVFTAAQEEQGGVDVNYSIGAYAGPNSFTLVASDNVPSGKIKMIFIPGNADLMTYKYYPYTFNVEQGYRDPRTPLVPNIMVTRRDTKEELTPMIAEITILGNNGSIARTFTV